MSKRMSAAVITVTLAVGSVAALPAATAQGRIAVHVDGPDGPLVGTADWSPRCHKSD